LKPDLDDDRLTTASLYLDLLKRVLTRSGFTSYQLPAPLGWQRRVYSRLSGLLARRGLKLLKEVQPAMRQEGRDWPADAETMTGLKRLDALQECIEDILARQVPGDFIETGVWRGGSCIFMRGALKAYGDTTRKVWAADSFQGLPKPESNDPSQVADQLWKFPELAISLEQVKENFARYGLLDGQVEFIQGWFQDTLPEAPVERQALMRLDGDMFDSTTVALESLYPKLSVGGYVIVDDYGAVAECRSAVDYFRARHGITDEITEIDWTGVFWQRT
jgi:O-methyltransferase